MRHFTLPLLALGLAAAAPVAAQQAAPQTVPFSGLHAEGMVGYDAVSDGGDQSSSSSDGIVYAFSAGYDVPVGRILLGAEAEIGGSTTDTRTDNFIAAGDRLRLDAGRDLYIGGRVGFPISDVALGYLKAGYTNAQVDVRYDLGNTRVSDDAKLDGLRLGAGLEYRLAGQTFIKGEYRYSNYSRVEGFDTDVDRHQVLAGLGLRF